MTRFFRETLPTFAASRVRCLGCGEIFGWDRPRAKDDPRVCSWCDRDDPAWDGGPSWRWRFFHRLWLLLCGDVEMPDPGAAS